MAHHHDDHRWLDDHQPARLHHNRSGVLDHDVNGDPQYEHSVHYWSNDNCADDDCTRDHVYVIPHDEFHEHYVERPRFHEHDIDFNVYRRIFRHDHDGRALTHLHWPDSVQYAYNVVLPRPSGDHHHPGPDAA